MVASISMWYICETQEEMDVYEAYATQESMLSLKLNYVGFFTKSPGRTYVNEDFSFFNCIDIDEFSVHELNDVVKKLGFSGKTIMYYSFLRPDMNLDNRLYALGNDDDVRRMAKCVIMKLLDGVKPQNAPQTKMKLGRAVSGSCAKKLMLGWKQNDANVVGESSSRNADGQSSQPKTTTYWSL
ncbi:hypothetical protein Tco_0623429 [Tanacetum coccineum]